MEKIEFTYAIFDCIAVMIVEGILVRLDDVRGLIRLYGLTVSDLNQYENEYCYTILYGRDLIVDGSWWFEND